MKNLVIVESPAKAKTIEKYLGSDFKVLSSVGHIRSIAKKAKGGAEPIDVKNGFETVYEIDSEKKKTVAELRRAVKDAETVWLATDEDREGEAIAWHLCEVLKLDTKTTKRIVFHEITKDAIEKAIKNPRTIDMDLVRAQQARQILDRIVGFELSPVVWQKVPGGKSAGRVQSPAVRLLVEREREIDSFKGSFTFKVTAEFTSDGDVLKAELPNKFQTEDEAKEFLENLIDAKFTVTDVSTSPSTRNPSAPFTTSTLQQDANSRLGFSAKATMSAAQKLYQEGKITYMRTDSMTLSGQAIAAATEFIKSKYGPEYSLVRAFKTKSASAQEAHEAIRPTNMALEHASSNEYDQKLYNLIRNRTLASQMAPAKLEKTTVTIAITESPVRVVPGGAAPAFEDSEGISKEGANRATEPVVFEAKGEVIIFDGFLKVYGGSKKDADILPAVNSGDTLDLASVVARQVFARPPARYTEGALVKKLEDLGIGRPSTYATIINTVQVRGYAEKGENEGNPRDIIELSLQDNSVNKVIVQEKTGSDKGKLVPTAAGQILSDFLSNHFEQVVDYGFTASVEEQFDQIAAGSLARNTMLDNFYKPFHELIAGSGDIDRSKVAQAREVGIDPKSGKPILARFGRFGPMLQLGSTEDKDNKPQFAPMPKGVKIETVTLDEALHAFKLPRIVGETPEGETIKANIGRFGPYIQIGKLFVSIKPLDPHDITIEQALELYAAKLQAEAEKNIADFGDGIKVLRGRYGPYITDGTKNAKIPKDVKPEDVTHEQAIELIAAAPASKKRPFKSGKRKATTKKPTKKR
ncbi:MAG TPA: type I DNA topoisomerase [Candidatus Saccharibacteria bacterium]|nr:type I DNA topoisomerase [Candidatus Saccharibacteria bacterium]HRQ06846.1 type I DNA topoisomerase [Candidatus Saccharibacteria bacterium]